MKDYLERLTSSILMYEKYVNDDVIFKDMQILAFKIYKDYAIYSKVKYE